jgi:hypothetical protein
VLFVTAAKSSCIFAVCSGPHHTIPHTHMTQKQNSMGTGEEYLKINRFFKLKINKSLMWLYSTSFYEFNNDGNLIFVPGFLSHFRPEAFFPIFVPDPLSCAFSDALYFCIFLKFNLVIHLITLSTLLNINLIWH